MKNETAESGEPTLVPTADNSGGSKGTAALPEYFTNTGVNALVRELDTHTNLPANIRSEEINYTVAKGDSVFGIAKQFDLNANTILWANYDTLNDNPDTISVGMSLRIPPGNGVYYQWQEGDTLESVASKFQSNVESIINYPGNDLDLTNPEVKPGAYILIPGGKREYHQWLVPTIWRANAGASRNIVGGCDASASVMGTGTFVWPASNHYLSGNDYFEGHLGIDIAAGLGAPISASDAGVVTYAAPIGGGYGNMVMIDHGNGYLTLYAHLSQITTHCGAVVAQGGLIGYAGSTGNSTGPHLHFEVRYGSGFINPWYVLPPA
jgi:murein DD-endopeptidase MepM/ murein hydrolase activator NlpD